MRPKVQVWVAGETLLRVMFELLTDSFVGKCYQEAMCLEPLLGQE